MCKFYVTNVLMYCPSLYESQCGIGTKCLAAYNIGSYIDDGNLFMYTCMYTYTYRGKFLESSKLSLLLIYAATSITVVAAFQSNGR